MGQDMCGADNIGGVRAFSADVAGLLATELTRGDTNIEFFDLEEKLTSHDVYNFEVAGTHTYIADGIRVHNTSVLSFLESEELALLSDVQDIDGDGDLDFAVVRSEDGLHEVQVTLQVQGGDSLQVMREVTSSDGNGNVLYEQYLLGADGQKTVVTPLQFVQGQFAGEAVGSALTPFLAEALIGANGSHLEQLAADTVLSTVLENVGGTLGALVDIAGMNYGEFSIADQLEEISSAVFEDFGEELASNGIDSGVSIINSLIMAEIFESVETDGISGAVLEAFLGAGVNSFVTSGVNAGLEQLFDQLPDDSFWGGISESYTPTSFADTFSNSTALTSFVVGAVINEVLPDLETLEGQIASVITSTLVAVFAQLGSWGGPVGSVLGFFVGSVFDALFGGDDPDPQAWTKVGFNEDTGRFEITGTWEDDGGNTGLSREIAQAYVDAMNGFVDTVMSQSNNYSELARWSFGHYEEHLKNAGRNGQTFKEAQDAYIDAYVRDLGAVQLNDGQMGAVRALENLDVATLKLEQVAFSSMRDNLGFMNMLFDASLERGFRDPSDWTIPNYDLVTLYVVNLAFELDDLGHGQRVHENAFSSFNGFIGDPTPVSFFGSSTDANFRETLTRFLIAFESSHGGLPNDFNDNPIYDHIELLMDQLEIGSFQTFSEYANEFGYPSELLSDDEIYQLITSNLQIAHDYHTYLENTEEINAIIAAAPASAIAAGWIATLMSAEEMGLNDPYDLNGDAIDNVFYTADGDDIVRGFEGRDLIKAYGGNDTLDGGAGDDTLFGGNGDDLLYGGSHYDTMWGGNGNDTLDGGNGRDLVYGGDGNDVFYDNTQSDENGLDTVFGGNGQDTLLGRGGDDELHGEAAEDSIEGGNGNDLIYGGIHYDTLRGGNGDDTIYGGDGRDLIYGGEGNDVFHDNDQSDIHGWDTVFAHGGNDTLLGGGGNDELHGNQGNDSIEGGDGDDFIHGGLDLDVLNGGDGADVIYGGDGADTISGGMGDDRIIGEAGADVLQGDGGNDTASYENSNAGVFVRLWAGDGQGGHAEGDTLVDIENLIGSSHGDTLTGDGSDSRFEGGDGNDKFWGGAGEDTLLGGAGSDTLSGETGNDSLIGGSGSDVFHFADGYGADLIADFSIADGDVVRLTYLSAIADYSDLMANHLTETGGNAVISDGNGTTITLSGVSMSSLTEDDFLF